MRKDLLAMLCFLSPFMSKAGKDSIPEKINHECFKVLHVLGDRIKGNLIFSPSLVSHDIYILRMSTPSPEKTKIFPLGFARWKSKNGYRKSYRYEEFRAAGIEMSEGKNDLEHWIHDHSREEMPEGLEADSSVFYNSMIDFYGIWSPQFEKENTRNASFYSENGKLHADFMRRSGKIRQYQDSLIRYIELPFTDKTRSLIVISLKKGGYPTEEDFFKARKYAKDAQMEVSFPVLHLKGNYDLVESLSELHPELRKKFLPDFIDRDTIDFQSWKVSFRFEADEKGCSGILLHSLGGKKITQPMDYSGFSLDKPFLFFIFDESAGYILFAARVENPNG